MLCLVICFFMVVPPSNADKSTGDSKMLMQVRSHRLLNSLQVLRMSEAEDVGDDSLSLLIGTNVSSHEDDVSSLEVGEGAVKVGERRFPGSYSMPLLLSIGVSIFVVGGWLAPQLPAVLLSYVVCAIYISLSVSIDLLIAHQRRLNSTELADPYAFNPVCSVLLTEAVKLGTSTVLYMVSVQGSGLPFVPSTFTFSDVRWLCLPALIFTANNVLVFQAIGKNDMSAFGVFRDTMIIWTAVIWKCVFQVPLGTIRIFGIAVIFSGLVVNQVASHISKASLSLSFVWVLAMTLCNASGSVSNEFALKRNKGLSIDIQNMVLYFVSIILCFGLLAATDPQRLASPANYFAGFDVQTFTVVGLQAFAGLLVSRLLKYADSVMKTVATCLRGPCVVVVAPLIVVSPHTMPVILSSLVVASGCLIYLTQGPMNAAVPIKEKEARPILPTKQND